MTKQRSDWPDARHLKTMLLSSSVADTISEGKGYKDYME